jgi:hypothetical protein
MVHHRFHRGGRANPNGTIGPYTSRSNYRGRGQSIVATESA